HATFKLVGGKRDFPMDKVFRTAVTAATIGMAALFVSPQAQAEHGSAVGAGLVGLGIGAILGSMMGPPEVYFVPPPPGYYGPAVYGPPDYDGGEAYGPPDSYRPRRYRLPPAADRYGNRVPPRLKSPPAASYERRPAPMRPATAKTKPETAPVKQD